MNEKKHKDIQMKRKQNLALPIYFFLKKIIKKNKSFRI